MDVLKDWNSILTEVNIKNYFSDMKMFSLKNNPAYNKFPLHTKLMTFKKSTQVNKWSAGCQVIASNDDWTKFMKIMRQAQKIWRNSFTYTLIESEDIKQHA